MKHRELNNVPAADRKSSVGSYEWRRVGFNSCAVLCVEIASCFNSLATVSICPHIYLVSIFFALHLKDGLPTSLPQSRNSY